MKCCGCNESVDKDEVLDLDAATDHLDTIQRSFQKAAQKDYPLTASKSKSLKRFRSSLAEFLSRLIQNTHTSEILYDEVFCETFQTWLAAATSSRLRSFRHTTTVIALDFTTALCKVAVEVAKEFNAASRSRDAEAKKSHADKKRLQVMDDNVHEAHQQKVKLEEYLKEMFDGVFVHRYRDAEPSIRCECVRSLGQWMQTHPEHYLDGDHLRYLGWNLTDVVGSLKTGCRR
jgi:cohesin complex subunit SA-1/2